MRPYFESQGLALYHGDCRELMANLVDVDVVVADPPYGETSLGWDRRVQGWMELAPASSLWCFGSLRAFMAMAAARQFDDWKLAQDVVWKKHNGSNFHADRFRRVHELVAHFYRGLWRDIYADPVKTNDATARAVRRKQRPTHTGHIDGSFYVSEDGGPRLQLSVIEVRSCHGYAVHPTQKPLGILEPLIEYSAPRGGRVLDPFAGSGSTLIAAWRLGRRAVGIEIDERNCEIAAKRFEEELTVQVDLEAAA